MEEIRKEKEMEREKNKEDAKLHRELKELAQQYLNLRKRR